MAFPNVTPTTISVPPSGAVDLFSNVPFDPAYNHTVAFETLEAQTAYFNGLPKRSFNDSQYMRHTAGSLKLSCCMADVFRCNYMRFKNANMYFENKWFYAFINSIEYVNNNTCIIYYSIDVMQTWLFDYTLGQCFIERIHVKDDTPGKYLLDEELPTGDRMQYEQIDGVLDCPFPAGDYTNIIFWANAAQQTANSPVVSNVMNGISMLESDSPTVIFNKLAEITAAGGADSVVCVVQLPRDFIHGEGPAIFTDDFSDAKYSTRIEVDMNPFKKGADGKYYAKLGTYIPLNNKLFTSKYYGLMCTSSSGGSNTFAFEDFYKENNQAVFNMYTFVGTTPSVSIVPINYRGLAIDYEDEVECNDFPQCCYATDAYKAWLAQNGSSLDAAWKATQDSLNMGAASRLASLAGAGLSSLLGGGGNYSGLFSSVAGHFGNRRANAGVGQFQQLGGATVDASGIAGTAGNVVASGGGLIENYTNTRNAIIARMEDAQKLPDKSRGNAAPGMNYTRNSVGFIFYRYHIKEEYARLIDKYFSMYGYKVNQVGVPDIRSRPKWTFVKTGFCYFASSSVPADAEDQIYSIFNKGITFWRNPSEVGHYELAGQNK